jgi:putative transposase
MKDKQENQSGNSGRALTKQELIEALVAECTTEGDLFGPTGVFTRLKGAVMERLLEAEMTEHLGFERHERSSAGNSRNGYGEKTVQTESGPVRIRVPRDRDGTFEPHLVKKGQRRLEGFDDKVISLYARGMTTRDIQQHLRELYGTDVSPDLISRATDAIADELREWRERPLEDVYPIIYLDALFVHVRDGGMVSKRAFYVALGVQTDGHRDVLGFWSAETEGARFWLSVLTELKNRGVRDVLFVCADGLSGLANAIQAAFPRAVHQTCVVHLIRAAMRFVSYKDRKEVSDSLRAVYTGPNEEAADAALADVEKRFGRAYPSVARTFRDRWSDFIPFLSYPPEIRRILYTTNVVESLNSQLRKVLRQRGPLPNDDAVYKLLYLAIRNAQSRWHPTAGWLAARAQLDIIFEGRMLA